MTQNLMAAGNRVYNSSIIHSPKLSVIGNSFVKRQIQALCYFSFVDSPSSLADLEANLARTMNHLAQNAKDLEVHIGVHVAKELQLNMNSFYH